MNTAHGSIGFRLAHELEGILQGIAADGHISPDEMDRLQRWQGANAEFRKVRPFSELAAHVDHALADGQLTIEEAQDLLFVVSKLTTVNPYFDACRSGLQVLMGILAGVAADGVIHEREVAHLRAWMSDWSHICGVWPFTECESIVTRILLDGHLNGASEQLLRLSEHIPVRTVTTAGEAAPLTLRSLCAVAPELQFSSKTFVFTGESQRAERHALAAVVEDRRGRVDDNVTKRTDYLVVCDEGNAMWAFACYGRKVEKAYNLRRSGHPVLIVEERDFWDAVIP
jgi:hypothetical protein